MNGTTTTSRVVVMLVALGAALLLAEGALSLFARRSLSEFVRDEPAALPLDRPDAPGDADLRLHDGGPYAFHVDPLVGFVCAPDSVVTIAGATVHTDDLGMRVRPEIVDGDSSSDDPYRVVVLGDSVVFGFGVEDHETLASQLEAMLTAALGGRPVTCRTVAAPGWNHRNAVSFLLDHLDRYPADLVLYMPIGNDLADGDSVRESGFRRPVADVTAEDPLLGVSADRAERFLLEVGRMLRREGLELSRSDAGTACLNADLTRESSRRFDENAASIALLDEVLTRRGTRLVLLQFDEEPYVWHLWTRLVDLGLDLPVLPLFTGIPVELQLADDPHPSAAGQGVLAAWTVEGLAARGLVPGLSVENLPERAGDAEFAASRSPARGPAEWRGLSEDARTAAIRGVRPEIDLRTGRGVFQMLGGLNPDGTMGLRALVALSSRSDTLTLELAPLTGRDDLGDVPVTVSIDGVPAGTLLVRADEPVTQAHIALPAGVPRDAPVEVRLSVPRAVTTIHAGRAQMASLRLVRIAFER